MRNLVANLGIYAQKGILLWNKGLKCPVCKRTYRDSMNKEFIEKISECTNCDHLRTDRKEEV